MGTIEIHPVEIHEGNVYNMEDRETCTGPSGSSAIGKVSIAQTAILRLEC